MDERQRQIIEYRMDRANALLASLSAHGPRAFYSPQYELTAYFFVDSALQGWYVNPMTGMKHEAMCAPNLYQEPERELLQELLDYLRTGKPIDASCMERFDYSAEDFSKVWDEVSGLDLIPHKSS